MVRNTQINIVAISSGIYPDNKASNIRHLAILRGLSENGANVRLFSIYSEVNDVNTISNYYGVKINHVVKNNKLIGNVIFKSLFIYFSIIKTIKILFELKLSNELDVAILFTTSNVINFPFLITCKLLSAVTVHERTEYPFLQYNTGLLDKLKKWLYLYVTIPLFDILIVISTPLYDLFRKYSKKKIIILPIIVEPDRFKQSESSVFNHPYIAYCGDISVNKDGVNILIESFARIANEYPNYCLVLIGHSSNNSDKDTIWNIIKRRGLVSRVILTGMVSFKKVPDYLNHADALLLCRPDSIQAKYGLPTKLAEYLITGKPVIVTSVGDIPTYLTHGLHAYIAKPGDVDSFSENIKAILQDKEKAKSVGRNGKVVCLNLFNYKSSTKTLLDHFK